MLKWFSLVALLFQASPAAADTGTVGDAILRLDEWTIEGDRDNRRLVVRLTNVGDKPVRMVEGSVVFTDILGEDLAGIRLDNDVKFPPGESVLQAGGVNGPERILRMRPSTVRAAVHLRAVLYEDGTSEWFGSGQAIPGKAPLA